MNIHDISAGDWLDCGGTTGRVVKIDLKKNEVELDQPTATKNADFLDAIPLTRDNIEQFGFELKYIYQSVTDPENIQAYIYGLPDTRVRVIFYKDVTELSVANCQTHFTKYDGIIYVHQVQHAMRLCDIKKEIEYVD